MSEKLGTENIDEIFDALDLVSETGGKVYQDKVINLADLPHGIAMLAQAKEFMEAVAAFSKAKKEATDLDQSELLHLAARLIQVGNKYESARKGA